MKNKTEHILLIEFKNVKAKKKYGKKKVSEWIKLITGK